MIYDLLELDKKKLLSYSRLKAIESAELILRKIELKFSEDSKSKSLSNIAYFPPNVFLIIVTIVLNHNIAIFYFIFVIKNRNKDATKH